MHERIFYLGVLCVVVGFASFGSCFLPDIPDEYTDEDTLTNEGLLKADESQEGMLTFRLNDKYREHHLDFYLNEFRKRGFQYDHVGDIWNVTWCIFWAPPRWKDLKPWQRVNNLPNIKHVASKEKLHQIIENMKSRFGDEPFPFWPESFRLEFPEQFDQFRALYENNPNPPIFIIKRPALARGEGVHLVGSLEQVDALTETTSPCYPLARSKPIAQRYITDVLTIEGFKVTLRVYVTVTSLDPLRLYVFPDGLVRICSKKYSTDFNSLRSLYTHIDSIDINEANMEEFVNAVKHTGLEHEGLRVSIKTLLKMLQSQGHDSEKLWKDIQYLTLMSFISAEEEMYKGFMELAVNNRTQRVRPFEMVGFDILIDKNMKPWLLEINSTPSMAPHTHLENAIKESVIHDLFDLVDIENKDMKQLVSLTDEKWNILKSWPENRDKIVTSKSSNKPFDLSSITTHEDMWTIVETELEYPRRGHYQRAFPEVGGSQYLKYLHNQQRNKLIVDWIEAGMTLDDIVSSTAAV